MADRKKKRQLEQDEASCLLPETTLKAGIQPNKPFTSRNLPSKQPQQHDKQKQLQQACPNIEVANPVNQGGKTSFGNTQTVPQLRKPYTVPHILESKPSVCPAQQIEPPKETRLSKDSRKRKVLPECSNAPSESNITVFQLRKPHNMTHISETIPVQQILQTKDSKKQEVQNLPPEYSTNSSGSIQTVPQLHTSQSITHIAETTPVQQILQSKDSKKPELQNLLPEYSKESSFPQLRRPQITVPPTKQISQLSTATNLLSKDLKNLQVQTTLNDLALDIPQRKNLRAGGTRGLPCVIETNHVSLNINPKYETAIHYDVDITPLPRKRLIRKIWETFRVLHLKNYQIAFDDRKNAYAPTHLPRDSYIAEVLVSNDNSKQEAYKVSIKFAAEVNLRSLFDYMASGCKKQIPQDALQCVDVVLRNVSSLRFVKVGRCFFSEPRGRIVQLGDGMELWHGHFQSAVIGWKPFLNVDIANKGFPTEQLVIDLMAEMANSELKYITDDALNNVSKFLKGLKVRYEIPNYPNSRRVYRVNSLMEPPDRAKFIMDDGQKMSVLEYYKEVRKYNIKYPFLPVLWVGSRDRKIYFPPELCTILPGQVCQKQLNEIQTTNLIKNVTTSTQERKEKIIQSLQQINFNSDPVTKAFGLSVGNNFEKINARMLASPALQYKNGVTVKPSKGVWKPAEFLQTQSLENNSWTVMNLDRRTRNDSIENFVRMIMSSGKTLGMQIGNPLRPYATMDKFTPSKFEDFLNKNCLQLIFVIIPAYPTNIYSQVKQKAELVVGRLTQCIRSKTMFKMNTATVGNILLKINSKLNGHNHTIVDNYRPPCLRKPCIIMGADVTHPAPDVVDIPSIAAVTASCDPKAFQYNFSWRLQPARQEIIQDLESIVKEQLMFFRKTSNQIPQRIIFFRDGVSEGQFKQVMNEEVQAIRRACSSMGTPGSYRPAITFLVVQKRHHTRFFPTNHNESDDKHFNVRAGTVVDTIITHPTDIEYYLVSHASIQGVARPTKYRVLWDDSSTSEDELEALTYYLCHMFSRCTRSVSYPAPTYYAHLAALRARVYLDGKSVNLGNLDNEQKLRTIRHEIMRGKPMFFV